MSAIKNAVGTIENKMSNLESNMNVKIDELKANKKNQEENQKIIINNL